MRLKDLLLLTKDGEWGKGEPDDGLTEMQVIRGTDFATVRFGELEGIPTRFIPTVIALRKTLQPNDILIETAGGTKDQPTGRTVFLKERIFEIAHTALTCASFARFLRVDESLANPEYVYWFLQSIYKTDAMQKYHLQHTGVARFQYTTFSENTLVPLPSRGVQKNIAHILGTLDDKIELNRRINQTLEEMAQALFKSWFVDFDPVKAKALVLEAGGTPQQAEQAAMQSISGKSAEELESFKAAQPDAYAELAHTASLFPSRLTESELGPIPEGWHVKKAEEIAEISIGKTPPRKEAKWFTANGEQFRWASIRDMGASGVFIQKSSEGLTKEAVDKFNVRVVPGNTVILSFKLTVGRVAITDGPFLTNEAIAHFGQLDEKLSAQFLYLYLISFDYSSLGSTSSIATAVNSTSIKEMPVLIPGAELVRAFSILSEPWFDGIKALQNLTESFSSFRDSLLPKLLSSELEIPDELLAEVSA